MTTLEILMAMRNVAIILLAVVFVAAMVVRYRDGPGRRR